MDNLARGSSARPPPLPPSCQRTPRPTTYLFSHPRTSNSHTSPPLAHVLRFPCANPAQSSFPTHPTRPSRCRNPYRSAVSEDTLSNVTTKSETTWADFRNAVRDRIAADLEREALDAQGRRSVLLPSLDRAMAEARNQGLVGRAWLFGSFAWGEPQEQSDIDLLVEGCDDPFRLAASVSMACNRDVHAIPFDRAPQSLLDRVLSDGREL